MPLILILLGAGSTLLALVITWQVKTVGPGLLPVAKYNLMALPLLYLANTCIGMGLSKGHQITQSIPLWVAVQSFLYYGMITLLSLVILGNRISPLKALVAFALITAAIYLLKS